MFMRPSDRPERPKNGASRLIRETRALFGSDRRRTGDEPQVSIGSSRRTGSLLIDFYRLLLFVVILGYYSALVVAIIKIAEWSISLFDDSLFTSFLYVTLYIVCVVAALVVGIQLAWLLAKGMLGLVTSMHDRAGEHLDGFLLDREGHAQLYAKVAEVARRVDAPVPDEIRIASGGDCYVLERRRFSIAPDRKLVLVLGLPHLAVLTVTELKVILAHELAHFRRGDTSLGVFVYRFLESLRLTIDELERHRLRWLNPLYYFCRAYFRLFLRLSAPIRRQQELRADCFSAAAYGGELAARTLIKEWLVAHRFDAFAASYDEEASRNGDGRPQNVFRWFARTWRDLSPEGQAYLERRLVEEEVASFWDAYPAMHVRLATMRAFDENLAGREPQPARELLPEFAAIERRLHDELFGELRAPDAPSFAAQRNGRPHGLPAELLVRPPFAYRATRRWGSRSLRIGDRPTLPVRRSVP